MPGILGTDELPTCWTTVPGLADSTRRPTLRATSSVRGSHGWNAAGSFWYGRIGSSDIAWSVGGAVARSRQIPYGRVMRTVIGKRVHEVDVG